MTRIMECAMAAGQCVMRVQTLRPPLYSLAFVQPEIDTPVFTYALHDMHTMSVIENVHVKLGAAAHDAAEWLRKQGAQVYCSTSYAATELAFGKPVLSNYVHLVAVLIPSEGDTGSKRALQQWQDNHTQKGLVESPAWTARCTAAMRAGATHTILCTLYRDSDYNTILPGTFPQRALVCEDVPRHYLSMAPLEPAPHWVLESKFAAMVLWVTRQAGYRWTLVSNNDDAAWAYFTVLFEPV
jgi:hypothetical protein